MTAYDHEKDRIRDLILQKTKQQYNPGAMKPRIVTIIEEGGKPVSKLKLQWLFYAGMGDVSLHSHWNKREKTITKELIGEGRLVPTTVEDHYGVIKFQNIQNFDDVHWAKLSDGRFVIYELARAESFDDTLIVPEGLQLKAVELLERRMGFDLSIGKTMEDDPIILKDGTEITPILTNRDAAHLRLRQKGMPLPR